MKKIILLIFGALVGIPAICQTDIGYLYTNPSTPMHDSLIFPMELTKRGVVKWSPLKVVLRKVTDMNLKMGFTDAYIPESDIDGANAAGSSVRVLFFQTVVTADIRPEEKLLLENFIVELEKPGIYQPPTNQPGPDVTQNIDDTPGPLNTYMLNATTPYVGVVNQPDWSKWVHFKGNPWNEIHNDKTATFGYAKDSYLQVSWTGHKIEWYAEKARNHGIAAVSIDGGPDVIVDLYKNTTANGSELVFTWPQTPPAAPTNGTHTIRIKVTGTKNALATETNVSHDYLKVFKRP
jgi:hypothetical protein